MLKRVEPEDLIKFGLIPEFVGRLPVIATLDELAEDTLIEILTEPRNSLIKQFKKIFLMEGVELEFTSDALKAIATKALKRRTGARGLRSIIEQALLDTMYDLPSNKNAEKVVVDAGAIDGTGSPLVMYAEAAPTAVARAGGNKN